MGEIPDSLAVGVGRHFAKWLSVGRKNISGDDFGEIFASAISGEHRGKPLGIADVCWENCAWSVKTVSAKLPFEVEKIRAISGRNDVDYSFGIKDLTKDIQETGAAVLKIWNGRVDEALSEFEDLRIIALIRNMDRREYVLFEEEAVRFVPSHYVWEVNRNGNFIGSDKQTRRHCFTWQKGGRQLTIIRHVPASAYRFRMKKKPPLIADDQLMRLMNFQDDWIERVTIPLRVVA